MSIRKQLFLAVFTMITVFLFVFTGVFILEAAMPLPIAEAVRQALIYSPTLRAMKSEESAAVEQVGEARAMKAVKINLGIDDTRTDSPMMAFGARLNQGNISTSDFAPDRLNAPGTINNLRANLQIVAPISLGGMDRNAVSSAREGVKIANLDTLRARQEIIYRTIEIYLGAILARESVTVAEKACEGSVESVRNAEAAVEAQRTVRSDLLQARVHHSQNEENLLRRRNQYQLALDELAVIMGIPSAADFELNMPFLQQNCVACGEAPEKLIGIALAKRPDYIKVSHQEASFGNQECMARGMTRPHVSIGAAAEHNREDIGNAGHGNGLIFARVDWNVADGGEARHKALMARKKRDGLNDTAAAMADVIHLEIRTAITNINNALERIRVSSEAVTQSEESLRILRDRYTAGLAIMSDLLESDNSLLSHRMNHLQALYDYALSKARLKMALGELTPEECEILSTTATVSSTLKTSAE
ncbi:MAG: TolC family protein [Candidatus Riflebacteria bacterium]|nr:TolC family protein [Candidatus Riflebacteria bacterium]